MSNTHLNRLFTRDATRVTQRGIRRAGARPDRRRRSTGSLEALERRQMLDCGMCMDMRAIEDQRALNLVPDSAFVEYSVRSGVWDDPSIWSLGRAPQNGDNVLIGNGTTVTIAGDEAVSYNTDGTAARRAVNLLRVDGTLQFDTSPADAAHPALRRLLVDTVVVAPPNVPMLDASGSPVTDASGNSVYLFTNNNAKNPLSADPNDPAHPLNQGRLLIGTSDSPIPAGVKAEIVFADNGAVGNLDRTRPDVANPDPFQLGRGLVAMGPVRMYGQTVTSFTAVAAGNPDGSTTIAPSPKDPRTGTPVNGSITLASTPVGWQVGDRVVLTGNRATTIDGQGRIQNDVEQFAITAISADGRTISFDRPIVYTHTAPAGASIYLANVSRNIVLRSESITTANPIVDQYGVVVDNGVMHRGHVMFMHQMDVQISGVGFYGLGRTDKRNSLSDADPVPDPSNGGSLTNDVIDPTTGQRVMVPEVDANGRPVIDPATGKPVLVYARTGLNQRARYAVHFHNASEDDAGDATGYALINDSAVVDTPGWGIVNHGSDVDVTGNVVFNAVGAGYVTEQGDELGSFVGNIAIQSTGSGDDIRARQNIGDFGHEGDGFWFQGGYIDVRNNVATNQRSSGFVFFAQGLTQRMPMYDANGNVIEQVTTTTVPNDAEHGLPASWFDPKNVPDSVAVSDVPLKSFSGNTAYGVNTGFESWFALQNLGDSDPRRLVVDHFTTFATRAAGISTQYTNQAVFNDVTVLGDVYDLPNHKSAFIRNNETKNITYSNVDVEGFIFGIWTPVSGVNRIIGGRLENQLNVIVSSPTTRDRVIDVEGVEYVPLPTSRVLNGKTVAFAQPDQTDIFIASNIDTSLRDLTILFDPDVFKLGTLVLNGKQVYRAEQAADGVPFAGASADQNVPMELRYRRNSDGTFSNVPMTNRDLFETYGLALGGAVAPSDATVWTRAKNGISVNGLVGSPTSYRGDVKLASPKVTQFRVSDPGDAGFSNYGSVPAYIARYQIKDSNGNFLPPVSLGVTPLHQGWNLVPVRFSDPDAVSMYGAIRTLLIYGDDAAPTFLVGKNVPSSLNRVDVINGATFNLEGIIADDFAPIDYRRSFRLNDRTYIRDGLQTDSQGNQYVVIRLTIKDFAGNKTTQVISDPTFRIDSSVLAPESGVVKVVLQVRTTDPLLSSLGNRSLPAIVPSETLIALVSGDFLIPPPDKKKK